MVSTVDLRLQRLDDECMQNGPNFVEFLDSLADKVEEFEEISKIKAA